uniref:AlNc14C53G4092 protein n=1 Tax=Albugo laibachii Nc14 TaxID=890382 RepID=F0WBQ1_9STRA|nr:AlNc14C53G4092 [Albugo laibachii Nc14]CCA20535.1 AlNc14C97G5895 [Albugo laibachii Nc14]|eukprot:CCA20535.1 AlNc14C97G5895 [Albugo laibachii Nc14]
MAGKNWKSVQSTAISVIKPVVHWGFIPLIIYIGMRQDPTLTLWQVICPLATRNDPPAQLQ